ncbi:hypothetical protein A5673_21275 [Mycobacterium sp. E3198]|nr:hypothetical protein A5673_21275 [Mycobacterium sp. E3198]
MSLTVGSSFTLLNNTPGSATVFFLPGIGSDINSISPAGTTMATGGTAQVAVTFTGGGTSGVVLFGSTAPLTGAVGRVGLPGPNGFL